MDLHAEELLRLLERVAQQLLALRRRLADPAREEAGVAALERRLELLDAPAVLGERAAQLGAFSRKMSTQMRGFAPATRVISRNDAPAAASGIVPLDRRGADLVQEQVRERVRQVADEREQRSCASGSIATGTAPSDATNA
jgi:hypothetical protein